MLTNLASIISIRHSYKSKEQVTKIGFPLNNLWSVNHLVRLNLLLTVHLGWFYQLESRVPGKQLTRTDI